MSKTISSITAIWSDESFEGPCEFCKGSGRMAYGFYSGVSTFEDACYQCHGTGRYTPDPTCPTCGFPFDPGFRMNLGTICPMCCDEWTHQYFAAEPSAPGDAVDGGADGGER